MGICGQMSTAVASQPPAALPSFAAWWGRFEQRRFLWIRYEVAFCKQSCRSVSVVACWSAGGTLACFGLAGLGGGIEPDRLVVDLTADAQAVVVSWPDGGLPVEVSRARLAWPLDADALEDLRWYLEDYLLAPFGVWENRGPVVHE